MRLLSGTALGAVLGTSGVLAWASVAAQEAPKPVVPKGGTARSGAEAAADAKALEFFENKVRPLLAQQCNACHNEKNTKGGLRLDTAAGFFKGGDTGPLVVPGDPEKSLLLQAVNYTQDHLKMPPQGKLKPQQIADLTQWVKMGAPWPNYQGPGGGAQGPGGAWGKGGQLFSPEQKAFWAFQPVKDPAVPGVKNKAWVKSPIDAFILSRLEAKGLKPAAPADKRTLLRRVTFDLTGLPPTPAEVEAFLADNSPDAFARVVDRLLATPAYGERWGRHWLDVARYADSNGLDENTAFGNAWRYRDYVVKAFNQDKPYDQFVREQLAGDLMPASGNEELDRDRMVATGFLALGPKVLAEPDKQKMVMDIVDEQIDTTGKAFMAFTLGCARCHDHKFDPFPTRDYYSLAGIFKSTRTMATLNTVARVLERPLADKEAVARVEEHKQKLEAKQEELRRETERINLETSSALVADFHKYLVVGLEAAVEPLKGPAPFSLNLPGIRVLEAEKFARADVKVTNDGYGQGIGIIESAGRGAAFTEYDVTLEKAGEYQVALRYASSGSRPVRIKWDGQVVFPRAAAGDTGGFNPPNQEWLVEGTLTATAGKHVLRLEQASGALPHIDKIALVPPAPAGQAPAAPGSRPRINPTELAKQHNLNPDVLRRSAAYLLASRKRGGDPIFSAWHAFSALPEAGFAEAAQKLVAEWKSGSRLKSWHPSVAEAFSGEAPKSLEEVAQRYGKLFVQINKIWNGRVKASKKPINKLNDADQEALRQVLYGGNGAFGLDKIERFYTAEAKSGLEKLKGEEKTIVAAAPPPVPMAIAVEDEKAIANVKVHIRGNHLTLGEEAPRGFLRIISNEQPELPQATSGRLELAHWLTDPNHPLTARVMVNRIWQHHFGEGIVRSSDNFGKLGDRPSHPELLDWLAKRFVQKGWSIKAMHRLMLLSSTYQMSTAYDARAALADPENQLLWRMNRRRMEVEAIRDGILAVSGQLDRTMGGTLLATPNFAYVTNDQSGNAAQYDSPRRSIYLPVIRNAVFDVFQVFDFVEPSFLNGKRSSTTVAPQALFMMNGQFVLKQARAWAESLLGGSYADDAARVRAAYLTAYSRPAAQDEVDSSLQYLKLYEEKLGDRVKDPTERKKAAWQSLCQILFASSEFIYLN